MQPVSDEEYVTVHCQSLQGRPDYVFVVLEYDYKKRNLNRIANPQIHGLKLEILGENVNAISALDKEALYHLTRRNSNMRTDVTKNYDTIGAVLLTKTDCGDFIQWRGTETVDLFECDFTVTKRSENPN